MNKANLESHFESNRQRFIEEWATFLSFPSISADPDHTRDCVACADWLAAHLETMGFAVQKLTTGSKPIVFGERRGHPDRPTVLFYGHYDVQPVDPLELWESPPFAPTLRDGRMYARGAQDNKGQLFSAIKAIETLIRNDELHCTVKVLIEGDEESGSIMIMEAISTHRHLLRADIVMAADTNSVDSGAPTITMGLRGIVHFGIELAGPSHDLHSGIHGGRIPNPATAMARLLATLHREDGSVAVDGFYDGVREPSEEERALANAPGFDPQHYAALTGLPPVGGECGYTPIERTGFRPAVDVNGVHSGYGGAGTKTIIPATAIAKISARLVPGQDPERMLAAMIAHLQQRVPPGLRFRVTDTGIGGRAIRLDLRSKAVQMGHAVLDELSDGQTAFLWEGASVPILSKLPEMAGGDALLVGFGSEEDRIHAPNESFSIEQFKRGFQFAGMFLSRL